MKSAVDVTRVMIGMLWRYRRHVRTITADTGAEFCAHELVAAKLKTDIYFASPFSSCKRGLYENFYGLIRQYIRKGTDLRTVTEQQIADVERAEREAKKVPGI